jgi:predicted ATP-dependent serine protease
VNIPGEFTFYDSGVDVAIAAAIYSQYKDTLPDPNLVYI